MRIKEIANTRVHYGYRRVHVMLRREGWQDNVKRVYRLYQEQGLSLRMKRPKRNKSARLRQPKSLVTAMNQIWSMDFVADALFDGRKLRALTVVDNYTRESLAIDVGQSLKGDDVVATLNRIAATRGLPATIKVDNGSEFISKVMDRWAYERGVELDFSRPGKPTDNAKIESFNGRFRDEFLNEVLFSTLTDARTQIAGWKEDYNRHRPHSALGNIPPAEFAMKIRLEKGGIGLEINPRTLPCPGGKMGLRSAAQPVQDKRGLRIRRRCLQAIGPGSRGGSALPGSACWPFAAILARPSGPA
jgi:putative transposase